jgi:hypothetical protein
VRKIAIVVGVVLIVVLVVPLLIVALWKDADLGPGAQRWLTSPIPEVADDENLFYGIVGFSQAGSDDFVAAGAGLMEEANRALEELQKSEAPLSDEKALEAVSRAWGGEPIDDELKDLCRPIEKSCMEEWIATAAELNVLSERHRELLERLERLYGLTAYGMTLTPDYQAPFPSISQLATVHRLKMGLVGAGCASGDFVTALGDLRVDIAFNRRVMVEARLLLTKLIALAMLSEALHTYAECLDVNHHAFSEEGELAPLTLAERSLRKGMQTEFRSGARLLRQLDGHPQILSRETELPSWLVGWLYKPNRTVNLGYGFFAAMADISELPSSDLTEEVPKRLAALGPGVTEYVANPIGAILQEVAEPAMVDYPYRFHDLDGLIGLINAKRRLRERNVPGDGINAALADEDLIPWRNPYEDIPFRWNSTARNLGFGTPNRHPRDNSLYHAVGKD